MNAELSWKVTRVILKDYKKKELVNAADAILAEYILTKAEARQNGRSTKVLMFDAFGDARQAETFMGRAMDIQKLDAMVQAEGVLKRVKRSKQDQLRDICESIAELQRSGGI